MSRRERAAALKPEEASLGVMLTLLPEDDGLHAGCSSYQPALLQALETADLVLFDGTFWSDDELIRVQGSGATAREMGHVPYPEATAACALWRD